MDFNTLDVQGFDSAMRGMRNPLKSYDKADSEWTLDYSGEHFTIGPNDYKLAKGLWKGGTEHRKWMRQVIVWVEITAPRYWWSEFDTYKIGTSANSESTMHTILKAMLPESFLQKRTICLNYEVLATMYRQRKNHRLPQWSRDFVSWVKTLPYNQFITGDFND